MTPEQQVELAKAVCQRIARQTRVALQQMTDCRLSGEDTPLKNIWEEICVQRQSEESIFWPAYQQTIRAIVALRVRMLPRHEADAVLFQTDDAAETLDNQPTESHHPAINEPAMVDLILNDYIYADAANWSNKRIRAYLDSACQDGLS